MSSYVTRKTPGDTAWFRHDRFGMFIHWGLYSMPARHEWIKNMEKIPEEKYDKYFKYFNPDLYDPREWARQAKAAGMKYAVLTTKHHEGFCMWDSQYTDYKCTNTPAGRDLVREYVDAFRAEGLHVGFYYSLIDWHHPEFPIDRLHPRRDDPDAYEQSKGRDMHKYAEYMRNQVTELLTNYGKIDVLWFDFSYSDNNAGGEFSDANGRIDKSWMKGKGKDDSALSLAGTIGAGLVAGLNTCALSMLLLFLSVILENKRHSGLLAAAFLCSKFVCYLLIGFVLLGMLQQFNPHWLQPLAKGLLTGLGAVLIALNLWDAWQAHRENYGKIRNQLPYGLRGQLHRTIRAMTQKRVLVPATVALGFLVALGEFLCAGQLYLMRLLSGLHAGTAMQALNLAVYCAAFIAPSALLCALVLRGGSQVRMSAFLAEHMAAAKLLTAAAMLLLILSAWLL